MAALVIVLSALTIYQSPSGSSDGIGASDKTNVPEWYLLGSDNSLNNEMSYDQVLTDIYYSELERDSNNGNLR